MVIILDLRTVRILLVPNKEQRQYFYDASYYSDRMYNEALQWNIDYYATDKKFYSKFELTGMVTEFKKSNPEFTNVDRYILTEAVINLRTAFNRMRIGAGFPRFKKIGRKLSFGVRADRMTVETNRVRIPSLGWVKCKHCHYLTKYLDKDTLKSMKYHNPHIKFDGKYWVLTFGVEVNISSDEVTDEVIGIDLGIKNTIYTSNGVSEPNINHTRQVINLERRKKRLQRKVSRKYELNKQGKKYIKTRNIKRMEKQIRLIDRKLHNHRENYNHQITNKIIRRYPARIMLEDLKVRNMVKNRHLARAIQEQQFYRIRQLLIEKAVNTMSIQVGVIDWKYPSSKMCSRCGHVKKVLRLSERTFICGNCGLVIDRDYNASINIRDCKKYKLVAN